VFAYREMGKYSRDLERPCEPHAGDCRRRTAGDVSPVETDATGRRRQEVSEQVEAGRLARAIGPDQGMDGMAAHTKVDVLDGYEPLELLREPLCFEDCLLFRHRLPRGAAT